MFCRNYMARISCCSCWCGPHLQSNPEARSCFSHGGRPRSWDHICVAVRVCQRWCFRWALPWPGWSACWPWHFELWCLRYYTWRGMCSLSWLLFRVRTTGELGSLNKTWALLKTWFVKFWGVSKNIDCYFDVQFQFCVMWSSWIIMCKIAKI